MMYVLYMIDKPGSADLRTAHRAEHLDYLKKYPENIKVGGPLLSDDGENMIGSLMIVDFPSEKELGEFLANEPYTKAGLFRETTTTPWKRAIFRE